MMKVVNKFIKKIIIYIIITMLVLSCIVPNISYGYTKEEVGNAIAGYAKQFVESGNAAGTGSDGKVGILSRIDQEKAILFSAKLVEYFLTNEKYLEQFGQKIFHYLLLYCMVIKKKSFLVFSYHRK